MQIKVSFQCQVPLESLSSNALKNHVADNPDDLGYEVSRRRFCRQPKSHVNTVLINCSKRLNLIVIRIGSRFVRVLETESPVPYVKWVRDNGQGLMDCHKVKSGFGVFLEASGHFVGVFTKSVLSSSPGILEKIVANVKSWSVDDDVTSWPSHHDVLEEEMSWNDGHWEAVRNSNFNHYWNCQFSSESDDHEVKTPHCQLSPDAESFEPRLWHCEFSPNADPIQKSQDWSVDATSFDLNDWHASSSTGSKDWHVNDANFGASVLDINSWYSGDNNWYQDSNTGGPIPWT